MSLITPNVVPPPAKIQSAETELGWVLTMFGPLAQSLKRRWVLTAITLLGSVGALVVPRLWLLKDGTADPAGTPWVIVLGIAAAVAVTMDRIADAYDKRVAGIVLRGSQDTAENAVSDLNILLADAIEVSFFEGTSREKAIQTLARLLTLCAAKSIGPGSRASYYSLSADESGSRTLGAPVHATEYGRHDKPKRPFIEVDDPGHPIWRIMDGADESPEVMNATDAVYGVTWEEKEYVTFVSVPVKANEVQFGLLSVNCSNEGAIGGAQRATILAMARSMALVLAFTNGPRIMSSRLTSPQMTVVSISVNNNEKGARVEQQ